MQQDSYIITSKQSQVLRSQATVKHRWHKTHGEGETVPSCFARTYLHLVVYIQGAYNNVGSLVHPKIVTVFGTGTSYAP